jgi:hypothetical protein
LSFKGKGLKTSRFQAMGQQSFNLHRPTALLSKPSCSQHRSAAFASSHGSASQPCSRSANTATGLHTRRTPPAPPPPVVVFPSTPPPPLPGAGVGTSSRGGGGGRGTDGGSGADGGKFGNGGNGGKGARGVAAAAGAFAISSSGGGDGCGCGGCDGGGELGCVTGNGAHCHPPLTVTPHCSGTS